MAGTKPALSMHIFDCLNSPELQHINIPTLAELEAMPIGEAQNLISRLEADSYHGKGTVGVAAMP